jgi:predicted Zn-dependent protease
MRQVIRSARIVLAAAWLAGCASAGTDGADGGRSWTPTLPSVPFLNQKGTKATVISELKSGTYEPSSLAIGEEKDLARRRGEGLGFVRIAAVEQYLTELRTALIAASGVTGVPGRIRVLANPAFAAYSTPDGNVYVSMGWLQYVESRDEVAAILAHELAHVLLRHHSSDLVATTQRKGQALHELALSAKTTLSASKTPDKSDTRALGMEQLAADVTDKLVLPAWSRRQEREADLLGIDLLVRARCSPSAMITMLEKLQSWENQHKESEQSFEERLQQTAQRSPGEALRLAYQRVVDTVSASHPKTEERLEDAAGYLDRHYGDVKSDADSAAWKRLVGRADVAEVVRNYGRAFAARKALDKGNAQDAYRLAQQAAIGRTAGDAYPNWVLARAASLLGRQRDAIQALQRAVASPEPVPQIYEEMIFTHERGGDITAALAWTDKASTTFGEAPRWTPTKIRLLRKAGRTAEASALAVKCSVDTPEWRHQCQEANATPAAQSPR